MMFNPMTWGSGPGLAWNISPSQIFPPCLREMAATATSTQTKWYPRKQVIPSKTYSKINPTDTAIGNKNITITRKEAI